MRLHFLNRDKPENSSFSVTHHIEPHFLKVWHYHTELELVLTLKGKGTRFVGDSIKQFEEGDVVLIGKNLPHMWRNDDFDPEKDSTRLVEDIVIHFKKEFLGMPFLEAIEMRPISKLLERSRYGIKFLRPSGLIIEAIENLDRLNPGFDRTLLFLKILDTLARLEDYELLASEGFLNTFKENQNEIMDSTYEFIFENFAKPITLQDVANVARMNPSAFSRFFKRVNRKTFSKYLNEVRIGYACKQLIENKGSITNICYESGYHNISNFNRQFRALMKMTPSEYLAKQNSRIK